MRGCIPGRNETPLEPVIDAWDLNLFGSILELGPGNGQLEPMVLAAGGKYIGVDKDPRAGVVVLDYEKHPGRLPRHLYNGIFCRNSIGTSWSSLPALAREIHVRLMYDAWAWLALWTGDSTNEQVNEAVWAFNRHGFVLDTRYAGTNQVLVTRGLS